MEPKYLCVDVGGTSLRIGVVSQAGELQESESFSSREIQDPGQLIQTLSLRLKEGISQCGGAQGNLAGIALGIPGLVQSSQGVLLQSPHFPKWKNVDLRTPLQDLGPFPLSIENDANQAAMGEAYFGAGLDWNDFILLTLGTGIGGGIIINREIFRGPSEFAGEVGHMIIEKSGKAGALGSSGTLESFASASGLGLQIPNGSNISTHPEDLAKKLTELAAQGDPLALEHWKILGENLACGLASLAHSLGIFKFILGGGLLGAWDYFQPGMHEEISKRLYPSTLPLLEIRPAGLGSQAGLIGGVAVLKNTYSST